MCHSCFLSMSSTYQSARMAPLNDSMICLHIPSTLSEVIAIFIKPVSVKTWTINIVHRLSLSRCIWPPHSLTTLRKLVVAVFHKGSSLANFDEGGQSYFNFIGMAYACTPIISTAKQLRSKCTTYRQDSFHGAVVIN